MEPGLLGQFTQYTHIDLHIACDCANQEYKKLDNKLHDINEADLKTSKSLIKSQTFDRIIETSSIPNIKFNAYFDRLSTNNNIITENTVDESKRYIDTNDLIIELILEITTNRKSRLKKVKVKGWILNLIYKR